jgi:hypothetical protein
VKNSSASSTTANKFKSRLSTITAGSEVSEFSIYGRVAGTEAVRFQIAGSDVIIPSGNTFNAPTYKVLDADGVTWKAALESSSTGILRIGNGFTNISITPTNISLAGDTLFTNANAGNGIQFNAGVTSTSGVIISRVTSITASSGDRHNLNIAGTFAPVGGSAVFNDLFLSATINQTSAATGGISMININPTVTSVTATLYGLRSQIAASPTGGGTAWNIYADGTAANWFGGAIQAQDDFKLQVAGKGIYVKEGSNATMGTATLSSGTVTVNTTKVTANSRIFLTIQSLGTVSVPKEIGVTARTAGTSFTITSADNTDTSVVSWIIIEPA